MDENRKKKKHPDKGPPPERGGAQPGGTLGHGDGGEGTRVDPETRHSFFQFTGRLHEAETQDEFFDDAAAFPADGETPSDPGLDEPEVSAPQDEPADSPEASATIETERPVETEPSAEDLEQTRTELFHTQADPAAGAESLSVPPSLRDVAPPAEAFLPPPEQPAPEPEPAPQETEEEKAPAPAPAPQPAEGDLEPRPEAAPQEGEGEVQPAPDAPLETEGDFEPLAPEPEPAGEEAAREVGPEIAQPDAETALDVPLHDARTSTDLPRGVQRPSEAETRHEDALEPGGAPDAATRTDLLGEQDRDVEIREATAVPDAPTKTDVLKDDSPLAAPEPETALDSDSAPPAGDATRTDLPREEYLRAPAQETHVDPDATATNAAGTRSAEEATRTDRAAPEELFGPGAPQQGSGTLTELGGPVAAPITPAPDTAPATHDRSRAPRPSRKRWQKPPRRGVVARIRGLFKKTPPPPAEGEWARPELEELEQEAVRFAEGGAESSSSSSSRRAEPEFDTDSDLLARLRRLNIELPAKRQEAEPKPVPEAPLPAHRKVLKALRHAGSQVWAGTKTVVFGPQGARTEIKPPRNAEWWRRTLTEIACLYAILIPIELVVSGGEIGSVGVHPHPYWLIVLPMAGARGVVAGIVSAAVAAILYVVGLIQGAGAFHPGDLFTLSKMLDPILFFGVAFFMGELHDEIALRYRHLERRLKDVQERNTRLRQERDVLSEANKELEKRIVDHTVQFGNLIVAATRIENADRREVFEVALDLVEEHCGSAASVLLVLEEGLLDMLCHRGWPDEELPQRLLAARESEFVQRAVAEGVPVNGFKPEETPPENGPLVVAPLFDSTGLVKALLCLDDVPPSRLNESTITIFFGVAEWISAALARVARGAEPPDPRRSFSVGPQADIWLGTSTELGERLRLEYERCARYGVATSVLAIQAPAWKDTSQEGIDTLDRFILTHFTSGLRPSDALYRFGYPGCYLLILAGTNVEGAEVVRTRLLRRVEYSPTKAVGAIEIFATGPDIEAPDLVSLADRLAAQFRKSSALPLEGRCPVTVPRQGTLGEIDELVRRIKLETSLATRNGFELHVVSVAAESRDPGNAGLLAQHVAEVSEVVLRPTDGVFRIGPHHCAVIMPSTSAEEAASVSHRLVQVVRQRDPHAPYGDIETHVMGLGPSHPDPGSFLDALAKQRPGSAAEAQEEEGLE